MDTVENLISYLQRIGEENVVNPIKNALGMRREVVTPAELPLSFERGNDTYKNPLYYIPNSTKPTDLPTSVAAYRADPTGKYGGKEGIETLPIQRLTKTDTSVKPDDLTSFNDSSKAVQEVYRYSRLLGAAQNLGLPSLKPEEIAALLLKEGRPNLGFNYVGLGNKQDKQFFDELQKKYNITDDDANFLTAIQQKQKIANRLKIPFAMAWNGTGVNVFGQSGSDYANDYENHKKAALHPKNKDLLNLINRAINDGVQYGLPLVENIDKDTHPQIRMEKYSSGGIAMPDNYRAGGRVRMI